MSPFARVTSISILQLLQSSLQKFRAESGAAMDDVMADVRRVSEWIHHDCKDYWTQEMRRAEEAVTQARLSLQQAQMSRRIAGHEPSCIDEQRALDRARRRLERAREKSRAVQHWSLAIDRAIDEFQQSRTKFVMWLETDMLQAVAALNRLSEALDKYVSLELPPDSPLLGAAGETSENAEQPPSSDGTQTPGGASVAAQSLNNETQSPEQPKSSNGADGERSHREEGAA
jgi:hypothetical protein